MESKELIQTGLDGIKRAIDRTLSGLTVEEVTWRPRPDANPIGLILFHMARSEDSFVNSFIQGKPQVWETGKWYVKLNKAIDDRGAHYTAEQCIAFEMPDLKDLQAYSDAVRKQTQEYLNGLTPDELNRRVETPSSSSGTQPAAPRRLPFEPIVGVMLSFTVIHLAQHAGEISYLRGLQRGMDK
jgi:uncharacterized damage-inducible protein DinB